MLNNFVGTYYRLANNWFDNVDMNNYRDKPINYLEIGTFYVANILSVAKSYELHNDSKLYYIDPWEDYNDYPEYKTQQSTIYNTFIKLLDIYTISHFKHRPVRVGIFECELVTVTNII